MPDAPITPEEIATVVSWLQDQPYANEPQRAMLNKAAALITEQARQNKVLRGVVEKYADVNDWACSSLLNDSTHSCTEKWSRSVCDNGHWYGEGDDGYELAQRALKEVDGV